VSRAAGSARAERRAAIDAVILVQEALSQAQTNISQAHSAWVDQATLAIESAMDDEAMQVLVTPAKGDL
jgi:hypothetical protein